MTYDPSLISKLRKIIPNQIAQDIVGVQPMPDFRTRYGFRNTYDPILVPGFRTRYDPILVPMTKENYKHFLRANNRKKQVDEDYLTNLGYIYHFSRKPLHDIFPQIEWCEKNLKKGAYVNFIFQHFWFAYERDYTLFILRWG